jgi:hypothetical protein
MKKTLLIQFLFLIIIKNKLSHQNNDNILAIKKTKKIKKLNKESIASLKETIKFIREKKINGKTAFPLCFNTKPIQTETGCSWFIFIEK